jgi:hypothetical protein
VQFLLLWRAETSSCVKKKKARISSFSSAGFFFFFVDWLVGYCSFLLPNGLSFYILRIRQDGGLYGFLV